MTKRQRAVGMGFQRDAWADILILQEAWERRHRMLFAYEAGATQVEIAKHLGVSQSRVNQLIRAAYKERGKPSPLEAYLSERPFTKSMACSSYLEKSNVGICLR